MDPIHPHVEAPQGVTVTLHVALPWFALFISPFIGKYNCPRSKYARVQVSGVLQRTLIVWFGPLPSDFDAWTLWDVMGYPPTPFDISPPKAYHQINLLKASYDQLRGNLGGR